MCIRDSPNVIYLKGQTDRGVAEIALQYNSRCV